MGDKNILSCLKNQLVNLLKGKDYKGVCLFVFWFKVICFQHSNLFVFLVFFFYDLLLIFKFVYIWFFLHSLSEFFSIKKKINIII